MKIQMAVLATAVIAIVGCDINKVDPGGGASTVTSVTARDSIGTASGGTEPDGGGVTPKVDSPQVAQGPGSLVGTIKFDGARPVHTPKAAKGQPKDAEVCAKDAAIPDESFVVGDNGGLKGVFVYLRKKPASYKDAYRPINTAVFDQKFCIFTSHSLLVAAGVEFQIGNSDTVSHNVNVGAVKNPKDNFTVGGLKSVQYTLKRTEDRPFRVNCDIHSWMDAYLLPTDHPFAAITDADGNFSIPDLPAGDHEFRIWHERGASIYLDSLKIKITPGDPTKLDKSYDRAAFKNLP